jgi:hypothetical protein
MIAKTLLKREWTQVLRRVGNSCSTSDNRRVTLVTNPKWDCDYDKCNITMTQIFRNG